LTDTQRLSRGRPGLLRSPTLRFVLVFCATALVGFALEVIPWVDTHMVAPFIEGISWLSGQLIQLGGGLAYVTNSVIHHPVNHSRIQIANGCSGIEAAILLVAGVMAFPATWRQRAIGWAAGTVAIMALNVLRIISLYYIIQYSREWFDWAHLYAWDVLIMVDGVVVFFLWIRWLPPTGRAHVQTATG
jgi:exosortase H (IPTLxxWG-CTERM-specific)